MASPFDEATHLWEAKNLGFRLCKIAFKKDAALFLAVLWRQQQLRSVMRPCTLPCVRLMAKDAVQLRVQRRTTQSP